MAGIFRAAGKGIGSNIAAQASSMFKFIGVGAPTKKAAKDMAHAFKVAGGDAMKDIGKQVGELDEHIASAVTKMSKSSGMSDKEIHKYMNNMIAESGAEWSKFQSSVKGTSNVNKDFARESVLAKKKQIAEGNMTNIMEKFGLSEGEAKNFLGAYGKRDDLMKAQQGVIGRAAGAPINLAKTYMKDGGPLATYAKGAAIITAGQFMNGSRTSLTEQNGQRDIAGIPFI